VIDQEELPSVEIPASADEKPEAAPDRRIDLMESQIREMSEQNKLFRMMLERPADPKAGEDDEPDEFLADADGTLNPSALLDSDDAISALYKNGVPSKKSIASFVSRQLDRQAQKMEAEVDRRIEARFKSVEQRATIYNEFPELQGEGRVELSRNALDLIKQAKEKGEGGMEWLALKAAQRSNAAPAPQGSRHSDRVRAAGGGMAGRAGGDGSQGVQLTSNTRMLLEAAGIDENDYVKQFAAKGRR